MLILTRNPGQIIMINDDISIHYVSIRGNQIRLGIDAPPHVTIHRKEIWHQIKEEKRREY